MSADLRPLLVGEDNPYGSDPRYALFPHPERSAGGRLCLLIMGLRRGDYLRRFERVNLCGGRWSTSEARSAAAALHRRASTRTLVLLGARVCAVFQVPFEPFSAWKTLADGSDVLGHRFPVDLPTPGLTTRLVAILPHPSGRCRIWNEPGAIERARATLAVAGVLTPEEAR